jgi:CheY-like chemotaxis protein
MKTKTGPFEILLVEDNLVTQMLVVHLLKNWDSTLQIDLAENGIKAIEKIKIKNYDLILMDLEMPIMNGHAATAIIRTTFPEPTKSIPIIAMTANASPDEYANCFDTGMNDYLAKPFEGKLLFDAIVRNIISPNTPNKKVDN